MLCPKNMVLPVHSPFYEPHCLFINLHYRFGVWSQQTWADSHHSLFLALVHHVFTRDGLSEVPAERREWSLFSMRRSLVITHKTLRESLPSHDRFAATSLSHNTVIPPHPQKKKEKKNESLAADVSRCGAKFCGEANLALITHQLWDEPCKFIRAGFMWQRQFDKNPYEVRSSEPGGD